MSPVLHTQYLGHAGYRITLVMPCKASFLAALDALHSVVPDAYAASEVASLMGPITDPHIGGDPFLNDPMLTEIRTDPQGWQARKAREHGDAVERGD